MDNEVKTSSSEPLRVLIVEDSPDDADLVLLELRRTGLRVHSERIDTQEAMRAALEREEWDVILCDYAMPTFSADQALSLVRELDKDLPFIIVSGTIGEEHAVKAMRGGCHDYIMKENLRRLVPAIERELREAKSRQARREAEQALRASEAKYRELVQNANSIILRLDPEGRITFCNEFAQKFFGFAPEELLGQHVIGTLFPERDSEGHAMAPFVETILAAPEEFPIAQMENIRRNGETVYVTWTNKTIRDKQGQTTGTLCIGTDVTATKVGERERRKLEGELQHAQKLESLGIMAGGIAHDFNNLLTVIRGNADLLEETLSLDPPEQTALSNIQNAADHAAAMTRALQAFSRPTRPEVRHIDANTLVQEAYNMLRRVVPAIIEFTTDLAPEPCPVAADPGQMQQVLVNLCVNARDAMPRGGNLTISTRTVGPDELPPAARSGSTQPKYVRIRVTDTGCGMNEETRKRVFDPFFTTKPKDMGTGLGLAICYRIIETHGGTIDLASEVGRGTTFTFFLPATEFSEATTAPGATPLHQGHGRILIVDDEEMVASLLQTLLESRGYQTLVSHDPEHAIVLARESTEPIDLGIIDYYLPHMTGTQCLQAIREKRPDLKAIIITGHGLSDELEEDDKTTVLYKPFSSELIAQTVRQQLGDDEA